jgi:hypothetical protein
MPAAPQPTTGRIYRLVVNHGAVVYVNDEEFKRADFAFHQLFLIEFSVTVALYLLDRYKKI